MSKKQVLADHIAARGALTDSDFEPYAAYMNGSVWGGTTDAQLERINAALLEAGYYVRRGGEVYSLRFEHFPEGHDVLFDAGFEARNAE